LARLYATLPKGEPCPFETLASRGLAAPAGGWARGALFTALLRDSDRFRYAGGAFTPRDEEEVAARRAQREEQQARQQWVEKVQRWRELLESGAWQATEDADAAEFLAQLRSLLALEKRSPHWALLARPLGLHNLHLLDVSSRLKGWLTMAGAWPDWPAIWLQWGEVGTRFAPPLRAEAKALSLAPVRSGERTDFRRLPTFTIDSEGTRDFDDAISILSAGPEGLVAALHIAEPDPALEPGHPLFEEAARRMSSVYTVQGVFPMFPRLLSNRRFSLLAGETRETLSFIFRIGEGEGALCSIERGLVRVRRNLTYEAAQTLLDEQPEAWGRLAGDCAALAATRARAGAVIMERRELRLNLRDPEQIRLSEIARSGPVYRLVEELAILHNREAGRYCRDHRLPAIYRVQHAPRKTHAGWDAPPELRLAARFTTRPGPHAGLACDRYIQTTSPIRRFPDLVMQRQIAGHVTRGTVAFRERSLLEQWAEQADHRLALYDEVSRRIEDDWKRRYLLQHPELELEATVLRRAEGDQGRVWLDSLRLAALCNLPADAGEGELFRVRLEAVDRDRRLVWVRPLNGR
jgi:exoribonuclease-2